MPSRIMKRFDTLDPITGTVSNPGGPNGGTVDLTAFATVKFQAKHAVSGAIIGGTVSARDAAGNWTYSQGTADVATAGTYSCEIEGTMANGKKSHFPNALANNPEIQIDADVDNQ